MQRWVLLLSAYRYVISYWSTQEHANTDCPRDYPCHRKKLLVFGNPPDAAVFNIAQILMLPPVTSDAIKPLQEHIQYLVRC